MSRAPARVAIALGSNMGDRAAHLAYAVHALARDIGGLSVSAFVETAPVDVAPNHPLYLNGTAVGTTRLAPRALLSRLLEIELERGRERPFPLAPRTLDLDLVLYGDEIIDEAGLIVPHPRFRTRAFVLEPLASIAGEMRDPVTGMTVSELLEALRRGAPRRR